MCQWAFKSAQVESACFTSIAKVKVIESLVSVIASSVFQSSPINRCNCVIYIHTMSTCVHLVTSRVHVLTCFFLCYTCTIVSH